MNTVHVISLASALFASTFSPHVPVLATPPTGVEATRLDDGALPRDSILGEWWTEGKEGRMKFVKAKSGMYEALIAAGKDDAKDVKNPDPKLRDRRLLGLVIMWHLAFEDGEYVGGYCYNPRDGGTYHIKAKMLAPNTLRVRGYLGIPLLGQNQTWTRVQ